MVFKYNGRDAAAYLHRRLPSLLSRRFPNLLAAPQAAAIEPWTACRLEIGDAAGWKPAVMLTLDDYKVQGRPVRTDGDAGFGTTAQRPRHRGMEMVPV